MIIAREKKKLEKEWESKKARLKAQFQEEKKETIV